MTSLLGLLGTGLAFLALCFAFASIVRMTQRSNVSEGNGNDAD